MKEKHTTQPHFNLSIGQWNINGYYSKSADINVREQILKYSPNGRFLVQQALPKTLHWFVLILISLQRWQHRARNETKHFVSPRLIGPQLQPHDLAAKQRCLDYHNQLESAALICLFHGLLGAATCGELSELSETDAERSTGVLLLSAAESNSEGP